MVGKKILIPPHANEAAHKQLIERLKDMTSKEIFQTAVDAGIYNEDGSLTEEYGGETIKET